MTCWKEQFSFGFLSETPQLVFSWTSIKILQPACVLFLTMVLVSWLWKQFQHRIFPAVWKWADLDTILSWECRSWHMVTFQVSDLLSMSLTSPPVWYLIYNLWSKTCSDHLFVDYETMKECTPIPSCLDFTHLCIVWLLYAVCSVFFQLPHPPYHEFHGCVNCNRK